MNRYAVLKELQPTAVRGGVQMSETQYAIMGFISGISPSSSTECHRPTPRVNVTSPGL